MTKCKTCGLLFHACSSCGLADWEWLYCSNTCLKTAPALQESKLKQAFAFFTKQQLEAAYVFLDEELPFSDAEATDIAGYIAGLGNNSLLEQLLAEGSYEHYELTTYIQLQLDKLA